MAEPFEIFIRGVPSLIQHAALVRCLADILHTHPFRSEGAQLMNFSVNLHRDRKRKNMHSGLGALTLPNGSSATLFLQLYGGNNRPTLSCDAYTPYGGRRMTFTRGRNPIRGDVLQFILSTPYKDPEEIAEQQKRIEQLEGRVSIISLQFGWQGRDDTFSIEWDAPHHPDGPLASEPSLTFVEDTNEINVSLGVVHDPVALPQSYQYCVAFRFSKVESLAFDNIHSSHPAILFTFTCPPAFELVHPQAGNDPHRHRLQHFPGGHQRVAPFTSFAMRIECHSPADFKEFKRMASTVHLPPAMQLPSGPIQRDLFSEWNMARLDSWIRSLEWDIAFQVQAILNNLYLDPEELLDLREDIQTIRRDCGLNKTREILVLFGSRLRMLYEEDEDDGPNLIKRILDKAKQDATEMHMEVRRRSQNPGIFDCLHVNVTPSRLILDGPFPDQSNRVLRLFPNHHHCFLRVCFTDEEMLNYRWDRGVDGAEFVRMRVGGLLKDSAGLDIAGRKFSFLAYSTSALREHAVWFMRPFRDDNGQNVTTDSIRRNLGDFSHIEYYPARMGARMSQAFTATEPSITLDLADEIIILPDIERNGSNFTDGVGEISKAVARKISRSLQKRPGSKKRFFIQPSAYQFRAGGFKGVIAINYKLQDMEITMRKSQKKFDAPVSDIEIAQSFYRPKPVYLNRYLIMILETLGVPQSSFIELQDDAVAEVEEASETLEKCAKFLDIHGCGTSFHMSSVFMNLRKIGVGLSSEATSFTLNDPFVDRAIEFATTHVLRVMKHKARIPVKGSFTLVGVADVHGYLKPDEVFVCIQDRESKPACLKGRVLVTRSPQVHPGDVQYANAIGRPPPGSPFEHERFPNCIVFSTQGDRSLPSMLSGGDLDGDEYNVILLQSLHPPTTYPPAQYPPATIKALDHPCGVDDLADWVAEYINSDILGFVADQFLILADQSEEMAMDPDCIKLAGLASKAVDFAKSGTPVDRKEIPPLRFPSHMRPDWSAGEVGHSRNGRRTYTSQRAIGKLFRRIDLSDVERMAAREAGRQHRNRQPRQQRRGEEQLSRAMESLSINGPSAAVMHHPISSALRLFLHKYIDVDSPVPADISAVAQKQYETYASELRYVCSASTLTLKPLTEEEVLMGTITAKTSQPRKRQSMQARLRTQTDEIIKAIRRQLSGKSALVDREEEENDEDLEDRLLRAWAAWQISVVQGQALGGKSFGMIALFVIFECARAIDERDQREGTLV